MGGSIEVSSAVGKGSVFRIWLPAGVESFSKEKEICPTTSRERHKFDDVKYGGRVLIAEDNPANQLLIQALLEKLGLQVSIACDGAVAVKMAAETAFDLILMDIQMPNLNGYQATQVLKKKGIKTPIIALTAHAMEGDRQKCLDAGCDDYLSKPVNKGRLSEMLGKYLKLQAETNSLVDKVDDLTDQTQQLTELCEDVQEPQSPVVDKRSDSPSPKQS